MEKFKTLKQLNAEFKKSLLDLEKMQNKIDMLYNHLKKELAAFEQTLKEVKEDKSKFTKNGRKKVENIEEEETTRGVEVAEEMVKMIIAQRAYESNTKAIQASDEMLGMANALRG